MYPERTLQKITERGKAVSQRATAVRLTATRSVAGRRPSGKTRPGQTDSKKAPAHTRTRVPNPLPASRRCIHAYCSPAWNLCLCIYCTLLAVCAAAVHNCGVAGANECAGTTTTTDESRLTDSHP